MGELPAGTVGTGEGGGLHHFSPEVPLPSFLLPILSLCEDAGVHFESCEFGGVLKVKRHESNSSGIAHERSNEGT
jgi:hypothetical protein